MGNMSNTAASSGTLALLPSQVHALDKYFHLNYTALLGVIYKGEKKNTCGEFVF
jgi:hypothetical protein